MNSASDTATSNEPPATTARPHDRRDRHVVLRHRMGIDGVGVPIIGGVFLLAVMLLVGVVSTFTDIRLSGWETGTQLIRWFVGAIGVYLTAIYLPLYVLHGRTRREVAIDSGMFAGVYAVLVAVLVTAGYAIEGLVYRVAGWSQTLDNVHLFDSPAQYHLILLEYTLVLAVWIAGGAMLGAAFYRSALLGMTMIPVGLAAVVLIEIGTGPGHLGPLPPPLMEVGGLELGVFSPLVAVGTSVLSCAVLAVVTWWILRDVPIRNQAS